MAKNPTNLDLYKLLGQIEEKVEQVHDQIKKTNGRVGTLEKWRDRLDIIDEYKKTPQEVRQEKGEGWTNREKTLTAIIAALLAIVSALVGTGSL